MTYPGLGRPRASIIELDLTRVIDGDLDKVMSWYDNEWGHANQMLRQAMSLMRADAIAAYLARGTRSAGEDPGGTCEAPQAFTTRRRR